MKWSAKATTNTVTTITAGSKVQLLTPTPGNEFITVENIVADSILTNAFQAKDAGLTSISGLTTAADKMIYTTALDTYAVADLSAFARTLLDDTDATSVRATIGVDASGTDNSTDVTLVTTTADYLSITGQAITLGLVDLSTDVTGSLATGTVPWSQLTSVPSTFAPDAHTLDSHSNVTITANSAGEILKWDGSAWVNNTLAEAGIDPAGTDNSTDVTLAGTLDYITLVGQVLTRNAVDLSTDVTGSLATGTVPWSQLTSVPSTFTPSAHNHASSEITSGTFADARIAASNVTQHQASIIIASSQISDKGSASGVASLDGTGKIPSSQLPALAITSVYTAVSEIAHLALTTQEGDVVVRTDENKSYIHNGGVAGTMADWQLLNTPTDTVLSVNGYTGSVTLSKSDVSLGSVENTALSTWAGTSSITTLGTIGTGTWQGGVVQPTYGGTGLTSISTLLNSNVTPATLGLVIGTNVQAYNARLSSIAGLTPASSLIIGNGLGGYEMVTPANFITNNNILDTGDIGVAVQAYNANLTAINQALTTTSSPTFVGLTLSGAVSGITTLGASGLSTLGSLSVTTTSTFGSVVTLGASTNGGTLSWTTSDFLVASKASKGLRIQVNGSSDAIVIDSSANTTVSGTLATGALTVTGAMSATTTISAPRINGSTGTGTLLLYGDSAATVGVTIADTGHVGIGATTFEAAWSGYSVLKIGSDNSIFGNTATNASAALFISQNLYNDGTNYRYVGASSNEASLIDMRNGTFSFRTAAAGTAGNIATLTTYLSISNTGAVSTTGTLASGALTVTGTGTFAGNITANSATARIQANSTGTNPAYDEWTNPAGSVRAGIDRLSGGGLFVGGNSSAYAAVFGHRGAYSTILYTNDIGRYEITSAGNHDFKSGTITTTGTLASGALTVTGTGAFSGSVTQTKSVDGDLSLTLSNVNAGTAARAFVRVAGGGGGASLTAYGSAYASISNWADSVGLVADGALDGGLFMYSSDKIRFQTAAGADQVLITPSAIALNSNTTVTGKITAVLASAPQGVFSGWSSTNGANAASGTIQLGTTDAYKGLVSYAADGNTTLSVDNTYDSASSVIQFRMRTAGTPLTPLSMTPTAVTVTGTGFFQNTGSTSVVSIFSTTNVLNEYATLRFGTVPGSRTKAEIRAVNANTGNAAGGLELYTNNGTALIKQIGLSYIGGISLLYNTTVTGTLGVSSRFSAGTSTPHATYTGWFRTASAGAVTASDQADDGVFENSAGGGISILTPDASVGSIYFGSPTSNIGGLVKWGYSTGEFRVGSRKVGGINALVGDNNITNLTLSGASGSELATFAGNVILGATKRLYLDGNGDTYISESSANTILFTAAGGGRASIDGNGLTVHSGTLESEVAIEAHTYLQGTTTNGFLDLRGDSGATKGVRLFDTGRVSIGGTTATAVLEIGSTSISTVQNLYFKNSSAEFRIGIAGGGSDIISGSGAGDAVISNTTASKSLIFGTFNTERARIDSSGSFLIGATATSSNAQFYATKTYSAASGTDASAFFSHSQSVATTGGLQGVTSIVAATHTTGTVGAVYGILGYGRASGAGGTTTNAYGGYFNVQNLSASAVITNGFGVYIAGFTATGTITNRWGIYQAGASEKNYFAGSLGIGTTTVTPALLNLGASTTSKASLNIPSGTAPTSPTNGDIWSDGSDLKVRLGGTTYTLTKS